MPSPGRAVPPRAGNEPDAPPPSRSLEEVLDVGAEILRSGLQRVAGGTLDYEDVSGVIARATTAIDGALRTSGHPDPRIARAELGAPATDLPLADAEDAALLSALRAVVAAAGEEPSLAADPFETLAVLLSLARDEPDSSGRVRRLLEPFLDTVPTDREREFWFAALGDLTAARLRPLFDRALDRSARGLRLARPPLAERLVAALEAARDPEAFETFWPWAANEILLGALPREPAATQALVRAVAALPRERLLLACPRLFARESIARRAIAPEAFRAKRTELFPLWIELLTAEESAPVVVPTVLGGLRSAPPPWAGAVVVWAIDPTWPGAPKLLARLLVEWPSAAASDGLVALAADAALRAVGALPESRRDASWLPPLLVWLGAAGVERARPLLRGVLRQRRRFLIPAWPPAARRAARSALLALETKA